MYTLNYFNAFYVIKEFLESTYGEGKRKSRYENTLYDHFNQRYLDTSSWICFASEYRNRLIHQTNIIRDFAGQKEKDEKELLICLEDFIKVQEKTGNDKEKRNAFIRRLRNLYNHSLSLGDQHYYRLLEAVENIDREMIDELELIINTAFIRDMKPCLELLLNLLHKEKNVYLYTTYNSETNSVFDPCTEIETYLIYSVINTGIDSPLSEKILNFLLQNGYMKLFTQKKTLVHFIEQQTSLTEM